jgi:hypothetical protein
VIGGDALVEGERTVGWYAVADLDARNVSMHKVFLACTADDSHVGSASALSRARACSALPSWQTQGRR